MKIAILIRVYDRVEDLKYNLRIIADTWKNNDYYIIVVSNGKRNGFVVDQSSIPKVDKLVILEENDGHMKGSAQLMREGIKHIPDDCDLTLILEADTWLYGDAIISKYAKKMLQSDIVWASANWYDKYVALATDFALIKSDYMRDNIKMFDFESFPECLVANYLRDNNAPYIWILENMPIHVPSYVSKYPYVHNDDRRFYLFPKAKMATHHIEHLKNGMLDKKRYLNIVAQCNYFEEAKVKCLKWERFKVLFWIKLSECFLKRSWYSKKQYKVLD